MVVRSVPSTTSRTVSHSASVNTSVFPLATIEALIEGAKRDARKGDRLAFHVEQRHSDESMTTKVTVSVSGTVNG